MYLEKFDLKGSVAVVIGGAGDIGLASAAALAECGAEVVIADNREDEGKSAAQKLCDAGHGARFVRIDVTDSGDVERCAQSLLASDGHVDILVNCAAIVFSGPGAEVPDADWRAVIDVDLNGLFWCCRAFGAIMLAQGSGSIVNMGSVAGLIAPRPQSNAHYSAAKAGVHMLTRSLAGEWAEKGVRVNAITPGYIDTALTRKGMETIPGEWPEMWLDMTPMHRMGRPDEVASAVLFLASDAASLMTGAVLVADAGYTVW